MSGVWPPNTIGVSAGFHDAGVSVINSNGDILFAAHSERYSRIKNDPNLNQDIIDGCTIAIQSSSPVSLLAALLVWSCDPSVLKILLIRR